MRFQVPLFIEHEPKVVGPFTFRQFLYLLLPGSAAFFSYFVLPFSLFLVVAISLGMLGLALGFLKVGGRDLPSLLSSFFIFLVGPKRYIWKKGPAPVQSSPTHYQSPEATLKEPGKREIELVQKSKIKDLATRVDTTR